MKPTHKQIEIAKMVKTLVGYWITTNDITSPTHGSDEHDELMKLVYDDILSEEEIEVIETALNNILYIINKVK